MPRHRAPAWSSSPPFPTRTGNKSSLLLACLVAGTGKVVVLLQRQQLIWCVLELTPGPPRPHGNRLPQPGLAQAVAVAALSTIIVAKYRETEREDRLLTQIAASITVDPVEEEELGPHGLAGTSCAC